jgi:hypothetical protein
VTPGIWSDASGQIAPAHTANEAVPGVAGATFAIFLIPFRFNDHGRLAFSANLTGMGVTTLNDGGLWSDATDLNGALQLVVQKGASAPGPGVLVMAALRFVSWVSAAVGTAAGWPG